MRGEQRRQDERRRRGGRQGGLAETPLPDPPTHPPLLRRAGLLKGSLNSKSELVLDTVLRETQRQGCENTAREERERGRKEKDGRAVLKRRAQRLGKWSRGGEPEAGRRERGRQKKE